MLTKFDGSDEFPYYSRIRSTCFAHSLMKEYNCLMCKCNETGKGLLRRAAFREGSEDNYLYCPASKDIFEDGKLFHFQKHWAKGEPLIVRDVLEETTHLSWEPMVMWRALCENVDSDISSKMSEVKAIDCLACCEV